MNSKIRVLVSITIGMALGTVLFVRYKKPVQTQVAQPVGHTHTVETLYGTYTVDDPVICELLGTDAVQRMKKINQHGAIVFVKDDERPYNRYEHSVGVWAILKRFNAPRKEQVAGLLHDVSHTVFSHVGDYVFRHADGAKSYQDNIHDWYLSQTQIPDILKKYGYCVHEIGLETGEFTMLDQEYPDLCVDRLEYNLHAGLDSGFITKKDIEAILNDLSFESGKWVFHTPEIARKFCAISLHYTQHVWGGPKSFYIESLVAHALRRAMEIGLVTKHEIHFSTDDIIWQRLQESSDPVIKQAMGLACDFDVVRDYKHAYTFGQVDTCDRLLKNKFRGIDPLVKMADGNFKRLSDVDTEHAKNYAQVKNIMAKGYPLVFEGTIVGSREYIQEVFA